MSIKHENVDLGRGTSLHCVISNKSNTKDSLLLIHGWVGSSKISSKYIALNARKYRIIAPDMKGFGDFIKPEPATT